MEPRTGFSGWYDRHVMPRLVGGLCGLPAVTRHRKRVLPQAYGRVLELGIGPGHNLALYDRSKVERVFGVDPVPEMTALAQPAIARAGFPVDMIQAGAEEIPLDSATADCAVLTYTACTLPDVPRAMAEIRRVLKPGGTVLFCEHGASCDADVCRTQDRFDATWAKLAGGCHLNRNIQRELEEAGFDVELVYADYTPWTPKFLGYTRAGFAQVR
jgi:ubiquinone/menaquinone biosynthesis C-methylase UbiE